MDNNTNSDDVVDEIILRARAHTITRKNLAIKCVEEKNHVQTHTC